MLRCYDDLTRLDSFEDRFEYLKLQGRVGASTFGFDRHINQRFYTSMEWRRTRDVVLTRDLGRDLGLPDREIPSRPIIHHMNPMSVADLVMGGEDIVDPEFLITVSHDTHNAIHYGDASLLAQPFVDRQAGDTSPWRTRR